MTVQAVVTNRFVYFPTVGTKTLKKLQAFYSYYPKGFRWSPLHKIYLRDIARLKSAGIDPATVTPAGWDGRIRLCQRGRVSSGLFRATREDAERELNLKFRVTYDRKNVDHKKHKYDTKDKYAHQGACVVNMLDALRKGGGLVLAGTGTGKTATAGKFFTCVPDYECLFVVDTIDLLYQSADELERWTNEPVGVVGNSEFRPERITVATIQTLKKHSMKPAFVKWFKWVSIVLVDELHDQMARKNFTIMNKINPLAVYGLTATLQLSRKDVRYRAYAFCGPVVFEFPLAEGVESGVLTDGSVLQLLFPERYQGDVRDYQEEYDDEVIRNPVKLRTVRDLVHKFVRDGKHVMLLGERVAHVKMLSYALESLPHELVWGGVKKTARKKARSLFEKSGINLIIANRVFRKGIDIKIVDCMIDVSEFKSKNNALQRYGRGVRLHDGKERLAYIDIGTQTGRFNQAAQSRARAFRAAKLEVKRVKIASSKEALEEAEKWLGVSNHRTGRQKRTTGL